MSLPFSNTRLGFRCATSPACDVDDCLGLERIELTWIFGWFSMTLCASVGVALVLGCW